MIINIIPAINEIHNGENTHHQLQVIIPHNFKIMNNKEFVDIFFELIAEEIARQEKYGSGFAVYALFFEQLDNIIPALHKFRTFASGEKCFDFVDDTDENR
jgi:hypothetical protein